MITDSSKLLFEYIGIQFLTGQAFDIKAITEAAHAKVTYV